MGTSLHYNKNGIKATLTILFTSIIITVFLIAFQTKGEAYSEENVWGTFYCDDSYEYDYGFLHYYSEGYAKGYNIWDDNADFINGSTWEGRWTDAGELINRRDRNKVLHNSDTRGWVLIRTEWQNQNNIFQYTGIAGHNEYQPNDFNPVYGYGCPPNGGVQDGGSSIYWGIQRFNRYRRAAIKIYRREKPKPFHQKTSVDVGMTPYYINGSTLWTKSGGNINIRAVGFDKYPDNYGQQSQYEACVRDTSIKVFSPDYSVLFGRTFNAMTNSVSVVNSNYDFGTNIFKGMWANWRGYGDNNRSFANGYFLHGLESTMIICPSNNLDLQIQARHKNKYNIESENPGEWHNGFAFGNEANERFQFLSTDGDAPTCSKMTFEKAGDTRFQITLSGVSDFRSGVMSVNVTVWNDQSQRKTYTTYKSGNDYKAVIVTSDFGNIVGNYHASAVLSDNVGNTKTVFSDLSVNVVADPIPTITDIMTESDFTGKTINYYIGNSIYVTAANSYFPQGVSQRYFAWRMKMPNGEIVDFTPGASTPSPEHYECITPPTNLLRNIAEGRYTLYLTAYYCDSYNNIRYATASCEFNITTEPGPFANIITRLR